MPPLASTDSGLDSDPDPGPDSGPELTPVGAAQRLAGLPAATRPALWLADRRAQAATHAAVRSTGFAALDAELPGGGWPAAGLTELLLVAPGSGELRLLAPLLAQDAAAPDRGGSLLCVAPPFLPYAPALRALGLPLERLLLVRPDTLADAAWAAEQGLRSGACTAVLWWQAEWRAPAAALATALRRLHLAAQEARCPLLALRPAASRAQSSPAPLRLLLEPAAQGQLAITVFKRRGPAMTAPLGLSLPVAGPPARRALRRAAAPLAPPPLAKSPEPADAVVRAAPERFAA
jgi:protein ImuA